MNTRNSDYSNRLINRCRLAILAIGLGAGFAATTMAQASAPDKIDQRVVRALKETGTEYEVASRDGIFRVTYSIKGKRTQTALISSDTDKINDAEMRTVFSFASISKTAPTQQLANRLLQENMEKVGFWALQKLADGQFAVVSILHVPAGASAKELEHAAMVVAEMADELEEQLTKKDVN